MEKTGVHVISKNVNYRRDRFKCLKIVEKDQEVDEIKEIVRIIELLKSEKEENEIYTISFHSA